MSDFVFKIEIDDDDLKKVNAKVAFDGIFNGMKKAVKLVERTTKNTYLSGRALRRRSGRLQKSIGSRVKKVGPVIIGQIGTLKYAVPYGPLWEFGGKYPRTVIQTKKAKALRFFTRGGEEVYAKSVDVPQRGIKARPYIQPSIKDNMPKILKLLGRSATEKMN